MIEKYQELLNKCIDIQEDNQRLKRMKNNLKVLKDKKKKLTLPAKVIC